MPLRDPEVQRLLEQGENLQTQAEKLLTQLEDHVDVLRTYVDSRQESEGDDSTEPGKGPDQ